MERVRVLLGKIPLLPLLIVAVFLGLAPFSPEPHLWEKLKMLAAGELHDLVDIFDLLMHGTPVVLLLAKLLFGRN
ncbi:MAG: RND transporter [Thiolinea sp.]